MKGLFLRFCRYALAMLGISGVISCDGDDDNMPAPEYGVPVMEFRISGKAVDAKTGEPVKGIAVTHINPEVQYDVSSNFVSADFRKMRTDSFQKS